MTVNQFRASIFTKTGGKVVSWRQKGIRCDNSECEQWHHIKYMYITFFAKEVKMHWEDQEAVSEGRWSLVHIWLLQVYSRRKKFPDQDWFSLTFSKLLLFTDCKQNSLTFPWSWKKNFHDFFHDCGNPENVSVDHDKSYVCDTETRIDESTLHYHYDIASFCHGIIVTSNHFEMQNCDIIYRYMW